MSTYVGNIIEKKDTRFYLLDPLSTIVKLIIISFKPLNCKLSIWNNRIIIQEPSIYQPAFRFMFGDTKSDLHFLSYPIEAACKFYLDEANVKNLSGVRMLFNQAKKGISKLTETYSDHSMIIHCLNFYDYVITYNLDILDKGVEYVDRNPKPKILSEGLQPSFKFDNEVVDILNSRWTDEKLSMLIEMVGFISGQNNEYHEEYLSCLEKFMKPVDKDSRMIILTHYK
jgi:hypothetical protein